MNDLKYTVYVGEMLVAAFDSVARALSYKRIVVSGFERAEVRVPVTVFGPDGEEVTQ